VPAAPADHHAITWDLNSANRAHVCHARAAIAARVIPNPTYEMPEGPLRPTPLASLWKLASEITRIGGAEALQAIIAFGRIKYTPDKKRLRSSCNPIRERLLLTS
jgi:hypothetical protein